MIKDIPLVIYRDGNREVVGEAVVHSDGTLDGKITSNEVSLGEVLKTGMVFGASLGPFRLEESWTDQSESLF